MSQLKLISGLPHNTTPERHARIIQQSVSRYFVNDGNGVETGGVCPVAEGVVWAGTVDAEVAASVRTVARAHKGRLEGVFPAAAVLHLGLSNSAFRWTDGRVCVDVTRSDAGVDAVRRRFASPAVVQCELAPVEGLAAVGDSAARFADAYGVAILDRSSPWFALSISAGDSTGPTAMKRVRVQLGIAGGALIVAAVSPIAAMSAARSWERELTALRQTQVWQASGVAATQLAHADEVLAATSAFQSQARLGPALAEIARLLPDHAVLSHLEIDGTAAHITIITHDADNVMNALRTSTRFANVAQVETNNRNSPVQNRSGVTIRLDILHNARSSMGAHRAAD